MSGHGYPIPVVRFVFNRPDLVAYGTRILRAVAPRTLIVVSDGPRRTHRADPDLVRQSREAALDIDWPCEVTTHFSATNLGCNARLLSGLDAAFDDHERLVVLEDDTIPHPSFFGWALRQLRRYDDDPTVDLISGHNMLGRWGSGDHFFSARGSVYGWAGWSTGWFGADRRPSPSRPPDLDDGLADLDCDRLVRAEARQTARVLSDGGEPSWDTTWTVMRLAAGRRAVVPTRNLVRNAGFGDRGTHTLNPDDFRAALPVFDAGTCDSTTPPASGVDHRYDRWALLTEYLSTYRNPEMVLRLHRRRSLLGRLEQTSQGRMSQHLAPFDDAAETIDLLRHLKAAGVRHEALDRLRSTFEEMTA